MMNVANLDERTQAAVAELQSTIAHHYPTATFSVSRGHDEPENVHLNVVVDVDDTDEVLDLVIDRVVELQVDERIPVHVIPVRTPERILAALKAHADADGRRPPRERPSSGERQPLTR
jgi:hypothetical protein